MVPISLHRLRPHGAEGALTYLARLTPGLADQLSQHSPRDPHSPASFRAWLLRSLHKALASRKTLVPNHRCWFCLLYEHLVTDASALTCPDTRDQIGWRFPGNLCHVVIFAEGIPGSRQQVFGHRLAARHICDHQPGHVLERRPHCDEMVQAPRSQRYTSWNVEPGRDRSFARPRSPVLSNLLSVSCESPSRGDPTGWQTASWGCLCSHPPAGRPPSG